MAMMQQLFVLVVFLIYNNFTKDQNLIELQRLGTDFQRELQRLGTEVWELKTHVRHELQELKTEVRELQTHVRHELQELKTEVWELKTEVWELTNKTEMLVRLVGEEDSRSLATSSAVKIEVSPAGSTGNKYGCGTLVQVNTTYYVATVKHVLYVTNSTLRSSSCLREFNLTLNSEIALVPKGTPLLHKTKDLALIPIDERSVPLDRTYPKIAEASRPFPSHLFGLAYKRNLVGLFGHVVEYDTNGQVQSDTPGTHGFSGAGLLYNTELTLLHKGEGSFSHLGEEIEEDGDGDVTLNELGIHQRLAETEFGNSFNNALKSKSTTEELVSNLTNLIRFHARNPRSMLVEAHHLLELLRPNYVQPKLKKC